MNSDGASHKHVLGSFNDFSTNLEQVCAFQGFESKEIVVKVSGVVNLSIDFVGMLQDSFVSIISEQRSWSPSLVLIVVKLFGDLSDVSVSGVVQILDYDAIGEDRVVWMHNRQICSCLCRQLIDFVGAHS